MTTEAEEFIEHAGVKGMRWGVRQQKQLDTHKRVGSGKGSKLDKLNALKTVSAVDLAKGRGLKGASANRAKMLQERKKRMEAGERNAMDTIAAVGGLRLVDLRPVRD